MPRLRVAAVAATLCLALGAGTVEGAATTPLNSNISWDSGAEQARAGNGRVVRIPGWTTTSTMTAVKYGSPGFPTRAEARASFGERNFFYCGRNTAGSVASQRIPIRGRNQLIDRGRTVLRLTVRIGSNSNDDSGRMIVWYFDRAGRVIGQSQTKAVSATGGTMRKIKRFAAVPPSTRSLRVTLKGSGSPGTDCDVFFDNVSVRLLRRKG